MNPWAVLASGSVPTHDMSIFEPASPPAESIRNLSVLVLAITYGLLRSAGVITRLIGSGGASILKRIMGMILAAYAVTLVLDGIADWLNLPKP